MNWWPFKKKAPPKPPKVDFLDKARLELDETQARLRVIEAQLQQRQQQRYER